MIISPSQEQKAITTVKNSITRLCSEKLPITQWSYRFRASSIPACQWYVAISKICEDFPEELPPDSTSFLKDFYVSVGSCVHTVFQKWFGKMGYLYGHYKCPKCGKIVRNHLGWPEKCSTKGCTPTEWEYLELSLHEFVPEVGLTSAHCDGLLHFPSMEENHYYLVDFKTCSLNTVPTSKVKLTSPDHIKYLTQTGFYHYILTKIGFNIDGTLLIFIPRDNPTQTVPVFYNQATMAERMFTEIVKDHKKAIQAATNGNLEGIIKSCSTANDKPDCPFSDLCFHPNDELEFLTRIFKRKFNKLPVYG